MDGNIAADHLVIPCLAGLGRGLAPFSYAFMRLCIGTVLVPHGVKLLHGGAAGTAKAVLAGWGRTCRWRCPLLLG